MMRSSKADRIPLLLSKGELKLVAIWFVMLALLASLALVFGCAATIPDGYDADTTPGHDGEAWVGGETPATTVTTKRIEPCDINDGFVFHSCSGADQFLVTDSKSFKGSDYVSNERFEALQRVLNFNCRVRQVIEEEIAADDELRTNDR